MDGGATTLARICARWAKDAFCFAFKRFPPEVVQCDIRKSWSWRLVTPVPSWSSLSLESTCLFIHFFHVGRTSSSGATMRDRAPGGTEIVQVSRDSGIALCSSLFHVLYHTIPTFPQSTPVLVRTVGSHDSCLMSPRSSID